ncbi:MAG: EscU/YscU/HrcU family type III secretion system export apparatus switch protein [Opitutaceae bacterium]|jgi:flagellar biosynthetic protein FlhB
MAEQDQDQKTEEPTGKRLNEAAEEGNFARSEEMQTVFVVTGAFIALSLTGRAMAHDVGELAVNVFSQLGHVRMQLDTAPSLLFDIIIMVGRLLAPVLGACILGAILSGGIQSGFQLSPKASNFKPEKLNPIPGLQRLFSKNNWIHGGIDLLKLVAISLVLWTVAKNLVKDPMFTAPVEAAYLGEYIERASYAFLSRLLLALSCIAAVSYAYEKYKTGQDLKMTREEVKDEHKQMEGSVQAKMAMRRMARRLLQRQMIGSIPTADVVVTNPTHYAVALKYERGVDKAPVVLAKGENSFAQRIKAIAAENGVPTIENKPVARALYAMGKVGQPIPIELYKVVAEILAFVYRTHRYYFFRLKSRRSEVRSQQGQSLPGLDAEDDVSGQTA